MFSWEFCEIFKNTFLYRTLPVALLLLLEFYRKIRFLGNIIFRSSIWFIILTDMSTNLFRREPFEAQNDSTTLFSQNFFHIGHYLQKSSEISIISRNYFQYLHQCWVRNIGVPGDIPVPVRSTFLELELACRKPSFQFDNFTLTF